MNFHVACMELSSLCHLKNHILQKKKYREFTISRIKIIYVAFKCQIHHRYNIVPLHERDQNTDVCLVIRTSTSRRAAADDRKQAAVGNSKRDGSANTRVSFRWYSPPLESLRLHHT